MCLFPMMYLTKIVIFPLPELELSEDRSNFASPLCRQLASGAMNYSVYYDT